MSKDLIYKGAKAQVRMSLKSGKDNAISRLALISLTGLSDRTIRNIIKDLRNDGLVIASTSKGVGYFIPQTREEAEHFINEMHKKGRKCFDATKSARDWLKENDRQLKADI